MDLRRYLPSAQFAVVAGAIALSAGLVFAADYVTGRRAEAPSTATVSTATQSNGDWLQNLRTVQAQSGTSLPQSPNPDSVSTLLNAAQSPNLTSTIGRSLFIKLSEAKSQGLGGDIPTQDALIADALLQVDLGRGTVTYTSADLNTVPTTQNSLHTYGNAVMATVQDHPGASFTNTLLAIGYATDNNDPSYLEPLAGIGEEYQALADDLAALDVPETLAPLHLQVVNDLARIATTYPDMAAIAGDPLRGFAAVQLYQSLIEETQRVLTNIAQQLAKNAILFDESEPGVAWSAFVSTQP